MMVTEQAFIPMLAYCAQDRSTFMVGPESSDCTICGRAPEWVIPFVSVAELMAGAPGDGPPPEPADTAPTAPYRVHCPDCNANLEVDIAAGSIAVTSAATREAAAAAAAADTVTAAASAETDERALPAGEASNGGGEDSPPVPAGSAPPAGQPAESQEPES